MGYTRDQVNVINICNVTFSSISLLATLCIFAIRIYKPMIFSNTMGTICMALAIINVMRTINRILGRTFLDIYPNAALCSFQAFMYVFTDTLYANTCVVIALTMTYVVYATNAGSKIDKYLRIAIATVYFISLPLGLMVLFIKPDGDHDLSGDGDMYCYIAQKYSVYRIYLNYIIVWVDFGICMLCYAATYLRVYFIQVGVDQYNNTVASKKEDKKRKASLILANRMMLYVIAFLVVYLPATINRVYQFATNTTSYGFGLLQAVLNPSSGTVDLIVFLYLSWTEIWGERRVKGGSGSESASALGKGSEKSDRMSVSREASIKQKSGQKSNEILNIGV